MEHDYLKNLVTRYLEKKSTDEELEVFMHLMQQGKLEDYLHNAMDHDIQNALEKDNMEVQEDETDPDEEVEGTFRTKKYSFLRWPVAAVIAMVILFWGYSLFQQRGTATLFVKITNNKSSILKKILPDGTAIWLNPHSVLTYPKKFGQLREVTMRGEAFFEVTKDHAHPFVITSGKVLTRVWGTSFRIRSIPGESSTKISVLTGKVSVTVPSEETANTDSEKTADRLFLLPQQEATYKATEHSLVKAPIPESSDVIIWRKSALSFDNASLKTIASELSKFYHVKLDVEGKALQDNTLTADFTDKNLEDILVLICKSVHTTYSKENDTIILRTTNN
ncbi:FecR family protein [Pedobacter westerhofensis]|uniref:FecR family protein n=1 Tax=Pedobacter westerhofensis TaxID=425512 RepID=A0A521BUQ3_9SPHI|nr:FecR domain-containing protein [Pedobacter westerhofensis]SMO50912.1 FecR family protein [Pedobacter westerhofensis]